jgi:hypothetical protein
MVDLTRPEIPSPGGEGEGQGEGGPRTLYHPHPNLPPLKWEGGSEFALYRKRSFASRPGVSTIPEGDTDPAKRAREVYRLAV